MPVVLLMYGISHGLSALCLFDGGWRDALLAACLGVSTGLSALELDSMISPKFVKSNGFFSFEQLPRSNYLASFVPIHYLLPKCGFISAGHSTRSWNNACRYRYLANADRRGHDETCVFTGRDTLDSHRYIDGPASCVLGKPKERVRYCTACPYTLSRWQCVAAFPMMLISISIISNSSATQFTSQIIAGLCGLLVYAACAVLRFSTEMTVTLAAMVVALVGHIFTICNCRPSLVPTLAGISLLVRGGLSVCGAAQSIVGREEFGEIGSIFISVRTVAASLSLGVFIANVMINPGRQPKLERLELLRA
ncbi:Domain of hypothetical protein function DUF3815 [Perkinsela sp. CCAP 1560/4]|nr:Domain of hypothetical protein function DUF3815 [Perkinsela sp. CCAP 1560/4]|eukprot:KNH08087.1 Domain of hypothetical protein function DUF3815 [Perkinsela sp. CCAP 1560/4]